jgi:hypothetical protein
MVLSVLSESQVLQPDAEHVLADLSHEVLVFSPGTLGHDRGGSEFQREPGPDELAGYEQLAHLRRPHASSAALPVRCRLHRQVLGDGEELVGGTPRGRAAP